MALWGDINVALNRLVAQGVIARFWTNLGDRNALLSVHVIVAPSAPVDEAGVEAIRKAVSAVLTPILEEVTITIDQSGGPLSGG